MFSKKCGMGNLPFEYIEISSKSGENIGLCFMRELSLLPLVILTWVS